MQNNALVSYVIEVLIKEFTLDTSWELEKGKTFNKWILISKEVDVCGKCFFSPVISESRSVADLEEGPGGDAPPPLFWVKKE